MGNETDFDGLALGDLKGTLGQFFEAIGKLLIGDCWPGRLQATSVANMNEVQNVFRFM